MDRPNVNVLELLDIIDVALREKQDGRAELSRLALIGERAEAPTSATPGSAVAVSRGLIRAGAGAIALRALWFG